MERIYISMVRKIGNSHGVIIPADILKGCELQRGDEVLLCIGGKYKVYIKKITSEDILKLKQGEDLVINS